MKIVIAPGSFKGSLSAPRASQYIRAGLRSSLKNAELVVRPLADGGEGTARLLMVHKKGTWIPQRSIGPLPDMQLDTGYVWFAQKNVALIETAVTSGLSLLDYSQRDPLRTTTYGTGQLIQAAAEQGAQTILLGVGDSATVDGGIGALTALGWQFLDSRGRPVGFGGGSLGRIQRIHRPDSSDLPRITVLCDVDNPLLGEQGTARMYGPQKGATPEEVDYLEEGLSHFADCVKRQLGLNVATLPGGAGAGGLAAGLAAFLGAQLVPGARMIIHSVGLESTIANADWLVTGEGRLDAQSLHGKVVGTLGVLTEKYNLPVAVISGTLALHEKEWRDSGIQLVVPATPDSMPLPYAMQHADELLVAAGEALGRMLSRTPSPIGIPPTFGALHRPSEAFHNALVPESSSGFL